MYDEIGGSPAPGGERPRPQELPDDSAAIEASGCSRSCDITQYDWEITYDADGYIDLLDTFSGHIDMTDPAAGAALRRDPAAPGPAGRRLARRHWGVALHVARRREA